MLYDFTMNTLEGMPASMKTYQGSVLLIVNTASKCGFSAQYQALEALFQRYRDQGFWVLGFPCNQFGGQEPGTPEEISAFCKKYYQVSFPLFEKTEVNGKSAHPLWHYLAQAAPGMLNTRRIKWNFTKFLVSRDGQHITRFAPTDRPETFVSHIETALAEPIPSTLHSQ